MNPMADIILSVETETFSSKLVARQGCLLLSPLFNIVLKGLAKEIRQEKEIKGTQIGK